MRVESAVEPALGFYTEVKYHSPASLKPGFSGASKLVGGLVSRFRIHFGISGSVNRLPLCKTWPTV